MRKVVVGLRSFYSVAHQSKNTTPQLNRSEKVKGTTMKSIVRMTMVLALTATSALAQSEFSVKRTRSAAHILNEQGAAEFTLGRNIEAVQLFKRAIEIDPEFAAAYNNLGAAYNALGRYQEAVVVLSSALRQRPDYAEAHYGLGVAYLNLGEYSKAVKAYQEAVRLNPNFSEARNSLGVAYNNWGKY